MNLVLFDIDGTLIWTDGAGRRAMEAALLAIFGVRGEKNYHYDGRTDKQIVRETLRHAGHDDLAVDRHMDEVLAEYLLRLEDELASPTATLTVLPGVFDVLDALGKRDDCLTGLLTGNLEHGAAKKLGRLGIDPGRFAVAAYGSDHEIRSELPAIARERARERGHALTGDSIVIIGDTPADIACGRDIGARAIGVATGRYSVEDLAAHNPAAVFRDLSDTRAVVAAIFGSDA